MRKHQGILGLLIALAILVAPAVADTQEYWVNPNGDGTYYDEYLYGTWYPNADDTWTYNSPDMCQTVHSVEAPPYYNEPYYDYYSGYDTYDTYETYEADTYYPVYTQPIATPIYTYPDYGYAPTYYGQASYPDYTYPSVQQYTTNVVYVEQPQPYVEVAAPVQTGCQAYAPTCCGDGWCSSGESTQSCPADCSPASYCGDGVCSNGETEASCAYDCEVEEVSISYCGDGVCKKGETKYSCPNDCGAAPYCGDGVCKGAETKQNCAEDCGLAPYCGNGKCDLDETKYNCAVDCGLPPYCGDGTCNGDETKYSCSLDCGLPVCSSPSGSDGEKTCKDQQILKCEGGLWDFEKSVQCCGDYDCPGGYDCKYNVCERKVPSGYCGDGKCVAGESATNCPCDCQPVVPTCTTCNIPRDYCGDGSCNNGETCSSCASDCGSCSRCGDGSCNNGETCSSCARDCGSCSRCGDGACNLQTENQQNCQEDCGSELIHAVSVSAADECFEVEQGLSTQFQLIIANTGNAYEGVSISATGPAAAWADYAPTVALAPESSQVVTIDVTVPENVEPGLYDLNLSLQNSHVSKSAVLRIDVKLPPLEDAIVVTDLTTNLTTTEGGDLEPLQPTGAFLVGDVRIPDWAMLVTVLLAMSLILILLIKRTDSTVPSSRLQNISRKVREPVLATDGGRPRF